MTARFMVILTEHERGWGAKPFHAEEFDDLAAAEAYEKQVNGENTLPTAPDYYITARIETDPRKFAGYKNLL